MHVCVCVCVCVKGVLVCVSLYGGGHVVRFLSALCIRRFSFVVCSPVPQPPLPPPLSVYRFLSLLCMTFSLHHVCACVCMCLCDRGEKGQITGGRSAHTTTRPCLAASRRPRGYRCPPPRLFSASIAAPLLPSLNMPCSIRAQSRRRVPRRCLKKRKRCAPSRTHCSP